MMANHRPLALTPFDPTHTAHVHAYKVHVHSKQLLGQPITTENTSFVFEFNMLALMSSTLNLEFYILFKII